MNKLRTLAGIAACGVFVAAAGCASKGTSKAPAKPADPKAAAAKPADPKAAAAKPGDPKAAAAKPADPEAAAAKPADPKAAAAKPADPKAAPAAAKPADPKAAAAKPPETKPADPKAPAAKPTDPKAAPAAAKPGDPKAPAAAKPGDPKAPAAKPGETKTAPATAAPAGAGLWASYDTWIQNQGRKLEKSSFLGMKMKPHLSEELAWTDNVFYQDRNEELVVNLDPPTDPTPGDANPPLNDPVGQIGDLVNTFIVGVDFTMPLNVALLPLVGEGQQTVDVFGAELTSVEYLIHEESPDALNYQFTFDLPFLVNDLIGRLFKSDHSKNTFYVRTEAYYANITDPLDVAQYQTFSTPADFREVGGRNDFERTEWWGKGTMGWQGQLFDAEASYRHYRFFLEDPSLQTADHTEQEVYAEIGYKMRGKAHRVYGLYEYTAYNFDERGFPTATNDDIVSMRDFTKSRVGMGWEGPLGSKKLKGGAEAYYLSTDVLHEGSYKNGDHPFDVDPGTGQTVRNGAGNPQYQGFEERAMLAFAADLTYRPFTSKGTQLQVSYDRDVEWSSVSQDKLVDSGTTTFTHPVNDKLSLDSSWTITMENLQAREKRLYNEFGLGARYKVAAFTEVYLRYTLRHMRSRREPVTQYADAANQLYLLKADGDFTANIISLGIAINF